MGQPYYTHVYISGALETIQLTYACVPWEIGEGAVLEEPVFVVWHAVADLLRDLGRGALQCVNLIQLGYGLGVLDPGKKLLVGNDPDCKMKHESELGVILYKHYSAPFGCSCAQSRNCLIMLMVLVGGDTPGRSICKREKLSSSVRDWTVRVSEPQCGWDGCKDQMAAGRHCLFIIVRTMSV